MANEYEDRKRLTFEQAEGTEPLPSQLELKEVSAELRARLWRIFHQWLSLMTVSDSIVPGHRYLEGPFVQLLYDWHVTRCFKTADEFSNSSGHWTGELKSIFMAGDYVTIFGFVQWVLRHGAKPYRLEIEIEDALRASQAAYAVFDDDTIIPIGSDA